MKKLIAILLCFMLSAQAAETLKPPAEDAAMADTATTAIALAQGNSEMNPVGFAGTIVFKIIYFLNRDKLSDDDKKKANHIATSVWSGATLNNLIVIFGGATGVAIPIGIIGGTVVYINNN